VRAYKRLLRGHLQLTGGETVLDIGCGTGDYADSFPEQHYVGLDFNSGYVERAKAAFSHLRNVSFRCMDLNELRAEQFCADHAYCVAVTHHLTDAEVRDLVRNAMSVVKGRFVVVDMYLPSPVTNPIGYLLVKIDRGRYGRSKERLLEVLRSAGTPIAAVSTDFGFPLAALAVTFERSSVEAGEEGGR
jgi:cyclopropane fatty-acyl-phospholipid synthase-like methyltransferase